MVGRPPSAPSPADLFPELAPADILERLATRWDLAGPLPRPRGDWLRCPVCSAPDVHAREWRIGSRNKPGGEPHRLTHRADVSFKCTWCAAVWWHGLAVGEDRARAWGWRSGVHVVPWRQAAALFRAAAGIAG